MKTSSKPSCEHLHFGIVIPAHNEQDQIGDCLTALKRARATFQSQYPHIAVDILVVLDACSDKTPAKVHQAHIQSISCNYRNVGRTRATGTEKLIAQGANWISCTDADSQVDADWLLAQYDAICANNQPYFCCDMICGVVYIDDWGTLSAHVRADYLSHYQDHMNHRHIHGANLSFSASAYQAVNGFAAMPCHEDVDLVHRFEGRGFNICWSNQVRVATSSRLVARADEGFAHFLNRLAQNSER